MDIDGHTFVRVNTYFILENERVIFSRMLA